MLNQESVVRDWSQRLESQYRESRATPIYYTSKSHIVEAALNTLQALVAMSSKAMDLAARFHLKKCAQGEREVKRRAREEKERAAKEKKWKEPGGQRKRERQGDGQEDLG